MRVMRRNDRQLPEEQAWQILRESDHGFLSMINDEGYPYCVPMAFALVGHTLYFHSGRKGEKLDSIRKNPRVCFTTVLYHKTLPADYSMLFASCVAEGEIYFVESPEERYTGIRAILEKYSPEYVDCPSYDRIMKGMPAVEIFALPVTELCGKANKGVLDPGAMMAMMHRAMNQPEEKD